MALRDTTSLALALDRWLLDKLLPDKSPIYGLLDELERHSAVVYPIVAAGVLALLVAGIRQAWRSQELRGAARVELRREILKILRRELGGMSAEQLSREVKQPPLALVRLLEEMQDDGLVTSHTNTQRLTTWHLRGAHGQGQGHGLRKPASP